MGMTIMHTCGAFGPIKIGLYGLDICQVIDNIDSFMCIYHCSGGVIAEQRFYQDYEHLHPGSYPQVSVIHSQWVVWYHRGHTLREFARHILSDPDTAWDSEHTFFGVYLIGSMSMVLIGPRGSLDQ